MRALILLCLLIIALTANLRTNPIKEETLDDNLNLSGMMVRGQHIFPIHILLNSVSDFQ